MHTPEDIRRQFQTYAVENDLEWFPEQSLVDPSQGSLFTNSFLTPFIDDLKHADSERTKAGSCVAMIQRTFRANQLEYTGRFPLVVSVESLASWIYFAERSPERPIRDILHALRTIYGIDMSQVFCLVSPETKFDLELENQGFSRAQQVVWDKSFPYVIAEAQRAGFYNRFFMKYQGGVLPLCEVGVLLTEGGHYHVDACFNVERMAFITSGLPDQYSLSSFKPLVDVLNVLVGPGEVAYLWAAHARSLFMLLEDGASIGNKKEAYVLKKMVRQCITQALVQHKTIPLFTQLADAASEAASALGYPLQRFKESAIELDLEASKATQSILEGTQWLQGVLEKPGLVVTLEEVERWKGEKGIPGLIIHQLLKDAGLLTEELDGILNPPDEFYLKNSGFPFQPRPEILDAHDWLRQAQYAHRNTKRQKRSHQIAEALRS